MTHWVKILQETQNTKVLSLGREDPLEEEMETQYSYLKNPMDRGAWWAVVHEVTRVRHNWVTKHNYLYKIMMKIHWFTILCNEL